MKTNTKKIILSISALITCTVVIAILFLVIREPKATAIFSKAANSVVELKAMNDEDFVSYGTAELISNGGEFVTNAHVVTYVQMGATNEFSKYYIRFTFEIEYREAELVKYDTVLDLALLRIKEKPSFKLKPVSFGNSSKLKSGDKVYAIGNSQNLGISIAQGIVGIPLIEIDYSARKRKVIQCDITIAEGNSGGALLNECGKLIGITTFRTKDIKGNVIYGIAYCIPINIVKDFING